LLTQLNVSGGSPLSLPIYESRPYEVKDISGLDPVPAVLTEVLYSDQSGGAPSMVNVASREITISLLLNPNYALGETVEELRRTLYAAFPGFSEVTLEFEDDVIGPLTIKGWVQSVTPSIFAPEAGVEIKVSCPDAYFKSEQVTTIASPVLSSGNYTVNYTGTAPAGIKFDVIPVTTNLTQFIMQKSGTTRFSYYQTVATGSRFAVNTQPGELAADLWTGAVKVDKRGAVSTWKALTLMPGANVLNFTWAGPAANPLKNLSWTNYYLGL